LDIEGKGLEAKEYQDRALDIDPNYSGEFFSREATITQIAAGTEEEQEEEDIFAAAL
jgi:hypothetical protein